MTIARGRRARRCRRRRRGGGGRDDARRQGRPKTMRIHPIPPRPPVAPARGRETRRFSNNFGSITVFENTFFFFFTTVLLHKVYTYVGTRDVKRSRSYFFVLCLPPDDDSFFR